MRTLQKMRSIAIALIFSIAIFTPFIIGICEKDKDVSSIEKRKLSKFPAIELTIDKISKFPKQFEDYYSDHFGIRELFTEYYKLFKFNIGNSPSDDVTIGKDGWLFLGSAKKGYNRFSDPMGDARNINLYSKNDLKKIAAHITSLNAWLNDKGIKYLFLIAPNKHTIYFDKLPDYITKANDKSSTDQLFDYLKSHTEVPFVDLRKSLLESRNKQQLYYKTDTHWNHCAANIAQYEIMKQIEKLFPNKITPEIFRIKEGIRGGGDLAGFIGAKNLRDSNPQPIFDNSFNPVKDPENASSREPHSFFCKGQKLNAVIFRDSFFTALQPYFSRKFKRSTYIWEKLTYASLEKYVNQENPDIVIEEWVERSLPHVPDIKLKYKLFSTQKLFAHSNKSIFSNHFIQLKYGSHIELMDSGNESLKMKSTGKDPIIRFPALPLEKDTQYAVHIEIKSSVKSVLQLFYSNRDASGFPFSEKNSVRATVDAGDNDIFLLLDYDNLGKQLRLDPIASTGEIEIKTIEIREI